jgi:colanic acid/amylovoran/stewartan biosynthesis glycosyltransferase WcaL/AmsK/CpsK
MSAMSTEKPIALERTDTFVGRTMNWLYDHLRLLPEYTPLVLCERLANRDEFPELEAWPMPHDQLSWRIWRRLTGNPVFPPFSRRVQRLDPRILHSHFGYVAEGDLALHRAVPCPWIVAFYGADVYELGRQGEWRDRYAPVFEEAAAVLALGPAMALALERLGCPKEKIAVHALGVDLATIPSATRLLAKDEELKILFAGTFREKKGVQYLLDAVHRARASGVRLRLRLIGDAARKPGDEETKAEIFRLIGSLGLTDIVEHRPFLPFTELMKLALGSHLFVAPSVTAGDGDSEGTPFVIQQMMASGMPVISTVHSDIPFLFGEHAHLLVPERDGRAIAERIVQYVSEPDRVPREGKALRDQIRTHFNLGDRAAALAGLYHRYSGNRNGERAPLAG